MTTLAHLMQPPKYADLFRYIGMPAIYNSQADLDRDRGISPGLVNGANTATQGYYTTEQEGGGEGGTREVQVWHPGTFNESASIPDKYKCIQSWNNEDTSAGPSGRTGFQLNKAMIDALPKTKFGSVDNVAWMGAGENPGAVQGTYGLPDLMNQGARYYDENYGWITPKANLYNKSEARNDAITNGILQSIMSFGMGPMGILPAGGIPSLASGLVGAAASMGNGGDWQKTLLNLAPSLIGAAGGGINLPPELAQMLKYAKMGYGAYNAAKSGDPVRQGMTLAQLYHMVNG